MKIAIDARVLEKGITGIGRYLSDILEGLGAIDDENEYILFSYQKIDSDNKKFKYIATGKAFLPEKIFSVFWLNFILPKYLKQNEIDLLFTPNQLLPLKNIRAKTVITVHDVAHKKNGIYHSFIYRMYMELFLSRSLNISDKIITVSNSARKDICDAYKVNPEKIKVIYEHADKKFAQVSVSNKDRHSLERKYNLSKKFILYVGVIENRKNITGILKTADIIQQKYKEISFVLIGRKGYGSGKIILEINKRRNFINYLSTVDDDDLVKIYNMAYAFFFPSYYEGFGLPPLEAMQAGVPVLASNSSSLPEVIGKGGIMKDPDDAAGFAGEIMKLIYDGNYHKMWKAEALKQAKRFGTMDSTGDLLEIFSELHN
ncbi:MAG: glycosyltransferase family 1 protein [Ignavibacteriaceae bacterium]